MFNTHKAIDITRAFLVENNIEFDRILATVSLVTKPRITVTGCTMTPSMFIKLCDQAGVLFNVTIDYKSAEQHDKNPSKVFEFKNDNLRETLDTGICQECGINPAGGAGVCEDCFYDIQPDEAPFEPECSVCGYVESMCMCDAMEQAYRRSIGIN